MRSQSIRRVAGKELTLFFASPVAYLFLASFLAISLFVFFWVEAFFARNIADVRPLFEWLPVLLLFLSAALTMRLWSEERRSGTLEFVATLPVSTWSFVLGKFLACWTLLAVALLLTLPVPISVALLANLDWGPVWAGYLAAMLLGGAYLAIGLFVSARTDNQIVSLILTALIGGALYLLGTGLLTDLVGTDQARLLRNLGTGSRFEAITRGVVDLRDLYYYISLIALFLTLNVYGLQQQRWAPDGNTQMHWQWRLGSGLLIANLLLANLWLTPLSNLRIDVTAGRMYSLSPTTQEYLANLQEPLLIRGYFSAKTHPLLAPLVPQLQDLLRELEIAGAGRVRVELVDPASAPELEDEANNKYGIRAVPFQVADRHQSSLVNSYFDVLLSYGDEFHVLSFRDLIDVKARGEADLEVRLRNPEYDLVRAIRRVVQGFAAGGDLFAALPEPVRFTAYASPVEQLPAVLVDLYQALPSMLADLAQTSDGNFQYQIVDPRAGDGALAEEIAARYGFEPLVTSLFDDNSFYFYLLLADAQREVQLMLPEDLSAETLRRNLEAELRRFAPGYLRSIAMLAPAGGEFGARQYRQLTDVLSENLQVQHTSLEEGRVPAAADLLLVVDPAELSEIQLLALDQYLMQGGTLVIAAAPFSTNVSQFSISAMPKDTGLDAWLAHQGVHMQQAFVMDPRNAAFPVPVTREVAGFRFQELRMLDYPYFIDIRDPGLNQDSPITSNLHQLTMPWASPITLAEQPDRQVTELLRSSPGSWLSNATDIMPQVDARGLASYRAEGDTGAQLLGVALEGEFTSYFADKDISALLAALDAQGLAPGLSVGGLLQRSPSSARLVLFSSNDFLADQTLGTLGAAEGRMYLNSLELMSNLVDWALADRSLLSIRARGHFNRTLPPLEEAEQNFWEYLNYGLALLGLGLVYALHLLRTRRKRLRYAAWLPAQEVSA